MKPLAAFFLLALPGLAGAQITDLNPAADLEPPRETPLVEKAWAEIPQDGISEDGRKALAFFPEKWRHAETPNFYLHFRRATEAHKVAREIEYDLAVVAKALGAAPAAYARKSHVFVFQDEAEWQEFVTENQMPEWMASFARGDELFLNVREETRGGSSFDSKTLAHETTHAVVARIYGTRYWPLWLNEGFAEYMGSAAVASRKNQSLGLHQNRLYHADLPLSELSAIKTYPTSVIEVSRLYQSSERFVRFMMSKNPPERFVPFVNQLIAGKALEDAIAAIYSDKYPTFEDFQQAYEKFDAHD